MSAPLRSPSTAHDAAAARSTRPAPRRAALAVHKFGGAALATGDAVAHAAAIVARRAPAPTIVVASALAGVTDALLDLARDAATEPPAVTRAAVAALRDRHLHALDGATAAGDDATRAAIVAAFDEFAALAATIRAAGQASDAALDAAAAHGERLAARILAAALERAGVAVAVVDAATVVCTDGRHGHAMPDVEATSRAARAHVAPHLARGTVVVIPGFVGRGAGDDVVTLGRGGSDLTATLLAHVLGARDVVLWKDVPGILTADPRVVAAPRVVPRLDAREAAALAGHGARVLHPRALLPLVGNAPAGGRRIARTRVHVRPFAEPAAAGTVVTAAPRAGPPAPRPTVKAIAATADQAVVAVTWHGFLRAPDVSARALAALERAGLAASVAAQAWSDRAMSLTVPAASAAAAVAALDAELAPELASGAAEPVSVRRGVTTVCLVGPVASDPATAGRALTALAAAEIPVLATGPAAAAAGLAIVVSAACAAAAQRVLHDAFEPGRDAGGRARRGGGAHASVVLLGAGAIGRALLAQVGAAAATRRAGSAPLRICAVVDSSGYLLDPAGLSRARLAEVARRKRAGRPIAGAPGARLASAETALAAIAAEHLPRPVLVDATAADTGALLEDAVRRGWDVVLANKIPLAGDQAAFDRLHAAARDTGAHLLHEATVGAGLPVIDTLRKLQAAGDRVLSIEGCPSGTLGFLFGELGRGHPFSDALRRAVAAGLTEPDPRVDLSGVDVARKALILGRLVGYRGGLDDVRVESLIPAALAELPISEFMNRAGELDAPWHRRVEAARAEDAVLRYRVRVTRRAVTVGLVAVDAGGRLGALHGTDNQFAITTTRYRDQPLVITGPGAGPTVTAAGVFADLLHVAALRGAGRPTALTAR